jgi:hypothetical protein
LAKYRNKDTLKKENNMGISLGFFVICAFLSITFVIIYSLFTKKNNENLGNNVYIKNIFMNIGLIILSGIMYILYEKISNKIYMEKQQTLFVGIITMFCIIFSNFIGLIFSIIHSEKTYVTLINYGGFIISTILTFKVISFCVNLLESNKIISECSSIIYILIIIVLENIFSYLIVKIIKRIKNGVRGNCT